jgi:N-acetylglucosamine kinase-like BadF-type ATPase
MILIADSGSTKTDWRLIDKSGAIHQFSTPGINPYFQDEHEIAEATIGAMLIPSLQEIAAAAELTEIHFYGAGCGAPAKKETVQRALQSKFSKAAVKVETDLLGAARSLCGSRAGLVAILGTGANTCYYDGNVIVENRPSLGYILGDEGSGAHIGKSFVQACLNGDLPDELCQRFFERFKTDKNDILDAVYRRPFPNRFLAGFSKFVYQNMKDPAIISLVSGCFNQFFDKQICRYKEHSTLQLNCTGSVAFYYSNLLRAVAVSRNVNMGSITETPIAGLTLFHLGEE